MNNIELMKYWIKSSDDDYEAMMSLYKNKKYTWCLFIGHLVIEKLIKAIYAKRNPESPHVIKKHDLLLLANKCNLKLDSDIDIAIISDDFKEDLADELLNLMRLRRNIDLRIEPHLIKTEEFRENETPFIDEVIKTGIELKVA